MLTTPFVTFSLRMVDNAYLYCITEFRYQFIPNVFFILLITFLASKVFKFADKNLRTFYMFSVPIIILNIACILAISGIYTKQLTPLKKMFTSIRSGLISGIINESQKLYIDKDLPDFMPSLCWNIEMGERYIKEGNYKWIFSKKELIAFTENPDDSYWIIDKELFTTVLRTEENLKKSGKEIREGKEDQYRELALYYIDQEDLAKAKKYVNILQEINPYNIDSKMTKKALELKILNLKN